MKAVIYARFSSDKQNEASIEGQLRECMDYAEKTGITVIGNYIDRALSARTDNRPEFRRMIKDSAKGCFDVVLVWKLDRFSRDRYESAHYKHLLKKNGVKVVSAKENISEGPEGIILESMLEGMAEYYSAELAVKVKRGMTENALKGRVNGGKPPYGYYVDKDRHLCINETTAPIVKEIFRMYAEGKLVREILAYLEERGIRTTNGKKFTFSILQKMLGSRRYIGEYKYGEVVIPNAVPAIIDETLFEKVQRRLEKNRRAAASGKAKEDYLLTTKLFCGKCGAYMVGESGVSRGKDIYRYYKCVNARKHTCDKKTVRKEWIENLAVQKAFEIVNDEKIVDYLVDKLFEMQGAANPRLPQLKAQMADVLKKIENIIQAIEQGIIFDSTRDRLAELEKQKSELEISILEEQIERPLLTQEQIRFGIERFRKLNIEKEEDKKCLIDNFINAIYLYDDKITFTFNYKDGTKTVLLSECDFTSVGSDTYCFGPPQKGHPNRCVLFVCSQGLQRVPNFGEAGKLCSLIIGMIFFSFECIFLCFDSLIECVYAYFFDKFICVNTKHEGAFLNFKIMLKNKKQRGMYALNS